MEPNESTGHMNDLTSTAGYALGVDVGTTFSAVGINRGGRTEIAPLGTRGWSVPSVVYLGADQTVLVGEPALRRMATDPLRVVREFKRRVGDPVPIVVGGTPVSAGTLSSVVIRAVVEEVVGLETGPPSHLVLTHPANWGPYKIDILEQAARAASLDMLCPFSTMSEPEAAAAYYASTERLDPGDVVAVYDLGGGTFDAAVLSRTDTGWELLSPAEGVEQLGGIDFDEAIFHYLDDATDRRIGQLDADDPETMSALLRLRRDCTDAKEALSSDTETTIKIALPNFHRDVRLTRPEFESMIQLPVRSSIDALLRVLHAANVEPEQLRAVLLVGGSSRIPLVSEIVTSSLHVPVAVDAHPKHSVALGAATVAYHRMLEGSQPGRSAPKYEGPASAAETAPSAGGHPAHDQVAGEFEAAGPVPPAAGSTVAGKSPHVLRIALIAGVAVLVAAVSIGAVLLRGSEAITGQPGDGSAQSSPSPTATTTGSSVTPTSLSPTRLPMTPAPLPDNQLVAPLMSNDNIDLYLVDASSGEVLSQLTSNTSEDRSPVLSPDRRTIVYIKQTDSTRDMNVMAADGTGERQLFAKPPQGCTRVNRPAWNPIEPDQLALSCIDGTGKYSLPIVTLDGEVVRVLDTGLARIDDLAFSPDGSKLAFWGSEPSEFDGGSIYVISSDGTATPTRLTNEKVGTDADPMWSPDGTEIVFRRRIPNDTARGNFDIYVMKSDGGGVSAITNHPAHDQDPVWSPDGTQIVFKSERDDAGGSGPNRLWIMNQDGSDQRLLRGSPYRAESATAWGAR